MHLNLPPPPLHAADVLDAQQKTRDDNGLTAQQLTNCNVVDTSTSDCLRGPSLITILFQSLQTIPTMSLRRAVDITTHVYKSVVANNYTAKKRVFYSRAVVEKTLEEFSNLASDSLRMQGKFFYKDLGKFKVSKRTGQLEFIPSKSFLDKVFNEWDES